MKKTYLFAAMAATIGLASCSNQDLTPAQTPGEATVCYTISLPSQLASRAYGEATKVTDLYYAVYATGTTDVLIENTLTGVMTDLKEDVTINLVTGKTYDLVFWSQAAGAPYSYDKTAQTITVDYSGIENGDETRDAFFAQVKGLKITGPMSQTVELRRPFAQLNIGTDDLAAVKPAVTKAEVTVPVYSTLNLMTGEVSDAQDVTFALADFPAAEAFPITGYDYMAMNYLLVNTRELVKVIMSTDDSTVDPLVYDNVPVQRNYRTNIYGSLLTTPTVFNVVIKPEFFEPDFDNYISVATATEFLDALAAGNTSMVLTDDITLPTGSGNIVAGTDDIAIELNNKTLNLGNSVLGAKDNKSVTVSNGTLELSASTGIQAQNNGVVTLENVTLSNKTTSGTSRLASINTGELNMTNVTADIERGIFVTNGTLNVEGSTISAGYKVLGNGALQGAADSKISVKNTTLDCPYGYAFATNATAPFTMVADFEGCTFTGLNPICINTPVTVNFTGCKMIGLQNNIVRGGTVSFTDCQIEMNFDVTDPVIAPYDLDYDDVAAQFMDGDWASGNQVPKGALCLGNRGTGYQYPTIVTFDGTNVVKCGGPQPQKFYTVYAYANTGAGLGVTFTYPEETTSFEGGKAPLYASSNIVVNGTEIVP